MSKPWGGSTGIGSWAAEAEAEEAAAATAAAANPQSFPTLKEGISAKPKKKKMSFAEFYTSGSTTTTSAVGSTRLTPDEMMQLPTAPKPRAADEYNTRGDRLGGAFMNYSSQDRGPRRGGFDDDSRRGGPRRGGGGGEFDSMPPPPSRADEVDNWAAAKRAAPPLMDSGRASGGASSRYGSLGGGSRADEVDNWNFNKKAGPTAPPVGRSNTFGSGFRDSGSDWRREDRPRDEMGTGGRPRLVLDPPKSGNDVEVPIVKAATNKPSPFGAARPREDVLAEKGLDWKKLDSEIEAKKAASSNAGSRPTSSQGGSRPTSSQSNRSESVGEVVKARPKVNPFGDAKPREVLLEQKGLDWRKIDLELEHKRVDRPETEEEKALREEIENLKKELEKESGNDVPQESGDEQTNIRDLLQIKEKELEVLTRELDDKVRFGQKAVDRPGSAAGRAPAFPERPPSQAGSFDGSRGADSMDRPRSRGGGDVWTRPGEDRRGGFQGSRDRGFLSNRDFDRSRSRERW